MEPDWNKAERLMHELYGGDERRSDAASAALERLLLPLLILFIRRWPQLRSDAEDIALDILVRLWMTRERGARYDWANERFRAWFLTVVRNHLRDELRRRGARAAEELPPEELVPDGAADELRSAPDLEEFVRRHNDCREQLAPHHRAAYDRHCQRDADGGDFQTAVADPLGLTYEQAAQRVHYARQRMRECLRRHGFEVVPRGTPHSPPTMIVALFRDRVTNELDEMLIYTPSIGREI